MYIRPAERRPGFISGLCQLLIDGVELSVSGAIRRLAPSHPQGESVCRQAKLTTQALQKIKAAELRLYEEYTALRRFSAQPRTSASGPSGLQRDPSGWNALHRAAFAGHRHVSPSRTVRAPRHGIRSRGQA